MSGLVQGTARVLRGMYDERTARFSATTSAVDGRYVSDFGGPNSVRYSVNCLLALARASAFEDVGWDARGATDAFLEGNRQLVRTDGDEGLLLSLLAELEHPAADAQHACAVRIAGGVRGGGRPCLQDAMWLLSGLSAYAGATGERSHRDAARSLFETVATAYVEPRSGFPLHSAARWRRHLVSFGGITYFLRGLWDYAAATGDERAISMFTALTGVMLRRQGESGEWPWLYHTASGQVAEKYPVYSVHQEGMAILFLFPALSLGVDGSAEAIRRSYRWVLGRNELGVPMWRSDPLIVYRSLRRRLPVANEFVRAQGGTLETVVERGRMFVRGTRHPSGGPVATAPAASLEINRECRSYEMGWTLFAWAGAKGFEEFTGAGMWTTEPALAGGGRCT